MVDMAERSATTVAAFQAELVWIPADQLVVDEEYQRDVNWRWVSEIADSFDPDLLDPLVVSDRGNGEYAVVDGQHRLLAIRRMGYADQNVPCMIRRAMSVEEEAHIFASQKNRKRLTRFDLHKADLRAGDPTAVAVDQAIREFGYTVSKSPAQRGIQAVSAVYRVMESYGAANLRYCLRIFREAWGDQAPQQHAILGLPAFLRRYGHQINRDRLVQSLASTNPSGFDRASKVLTGDYNESTASLGGRLIHRYYNRGMRTNRLSPWGTDDEEE